MFKSCQHNEKARTSKWDSIVGMMAECFSLSNEDFRVEMQAQLCMTSKNETLRAA